MKHVFSLAFITVILLSSCKKDDLTFNPELNGHWKYIGYIEDGSNDTIPPSIYHQCDSCMSLIIIEKSYYARSNVMIASTTGYSKGNVIHLAPWGPSEAIGEVELDETFWYGVVNPKTWSIRNEILELTSTHHTSTLIFKKK